jgi:hypothetical protein
MEGRKHYQLSLDWDCLGERRAEAMRMALSLPKDGKPLKGVGQVPSWLTNENAETLRKAPCMRGVVTDLRCRHCKPTPKPKTEDSSPPPSEEEPTNGDASSTAGEPEKVADADGQSAAA